MSRTKLDTVANIAIIVVCVIASAVLINNFLQSRQRAAQEPPQAEKGETFEELRAVVPAGAASALVVALQPQCGFCNESMPFYKRIVETRNQKGSNVKFVAAVGRPEARDEEAKKLAEAGVQPDALVQVDFSAIKVPGTPTVYHVDPEGKVLGVWVGKLDESAERNVLATL
jgi:hypothetical protein